MCRPSNDKLFKPPQNLLSCIAMAAGLCCHFLGYEWARAASISLLSAKEGGSTFSASALTFTVAVGCPASAMTLFLYSKSIRNCGAKFTFRMSNIFCIIMFLCMNILGRLKLQGLYFQVIVVSFYCFREIYVTLISTQLWSFIVSSLDKSTSSYIVSFGGFISVASAIGGFLVEKIVDSYGVQGLLVSSMAAMVLTAICSEIAYFWIDRPDSTERMGNAKNGNMSKLPTKKLSSMESWRLLMKNETLRILLLEAFMRQCSTNMLNLMFHDGLRIVIVENGYRAVVVGRFFTAVNVASCLLQNFLIPRILRQSTLPWVISTVPVIILCVSLLATFFPCLLTVMFAFGTLKVLEYAVLSGATEMIYMPMDDEVRYVGKEFVRFAGHKIGRTVASFSLSAASAQLSPSLSTQSLWGVALTVGWGCSMYVVSKHLVDRYLAAVTDDDEPTIKNSECSEFINNAGAVKSEVTKPSVVVSLAKFLRQPYAKSFGPLQVDASGSRLKTTVKLGELGEAVWHSASSSCSKSNSSRSSSRGDNDGEEDDDGEASSDHETISPSMSPSSPGYPIGVGVSVTVAQVPTGLVGVETAEAGEEQIGDGAENSGGMCFRSVPSTDCFRTVASEDDFALGVGCSLSTDEEEREGGHGGLGNARSGRALTHPRPEAKNDLGSDYSSELSIDRESTDRESSDRESSDRESSDRGDRESNEHLDRLDGADEQQQHEVRDGLNHDEWDEFCVLGVDQRLAGSEDSYDNCVFVDAPSEPRQWQHEILHSSSDYYSSSVDGVVRGGVIQGMTGSSELRRRVLSGDRDSAAVPSTANRRVPRQQARQQADSATDAISLTTPVADAVSKGTRKSLKGAVDPRGGGLMVRVGSAFISVNNLREHASD